MRSVAALPRTERLDYWYILWRFLKISCYIPGGANACRGYCFGSPDKR
ncbi:hypothetical protein IE996_13305 [Klebsiella pneumoniae]|uniref:Uncharacterized protein n=1 Tax=Klebsiella pneumoniae TaxID=573 RepID=A0A927HPT8_KLEPN|nr:hypothetical protein [Klebsiella pneumoniae]